METKNTEFTNFSGKCNALNGTLWTDTIHTILKKFN
jgi:hypothetical protein